MADSLPVMPLTAPVECGKSIKGESGTLTFADGQLRFDTGGRILFDAPLSSIQIVWHWYSLGGGFEATIRGQSYFLSFVPRGAGLGVWYSSLTIARQWRAALEGRPARVGSPIAARIFMVLIQIVMLFILACFALLSLGVAIEPASPTFVRILSGVTAAALGFTWITLTGKGVKSAFRAICGKK